MEDINPSVTNETSIYHLGQLLIDALKEQPDHINQIDGFTGEKETNSSVLNRSTRLANSFRSYGLQPGDVLALSGRNHLDIHIPYYAALFNGLPVLGVDPTFKYDEIHALFSITRPKIIFCQNDNLEVMITVIKDLEMDAKIVTFDGDYTMERFMNDNNHFGDSSEEPFKPTDIDAKSTFAWLVGTSGTTGAPKTAAFTHETIANTVHFYRSLFKSTWSGNITLNLAPLQWISSYSNALYTALQHNTKLQTSGPFTIDHIVEVINKYKPNNAMFSPTLLSQILNNKYPEECNLNCFISITLIGCKVYKDFVLELKGRTNALVTEAYGLTETIGAIFVPLPNLPVGCCGKYYPGRYFVKLIDIETGRTIEEPHKTGELLVKGPRFTEYYKNREETANAFTEDDYFKTGDLLYRDENNLYYFVERLKMLIKYNDYHIYPPELEEALRTHAGIQDVTIVGLPDKEFNEVPVACVVRRSGFKVTAQDIKDIIAHKFSEMKQLRGGVVFMEELPMTSTGKIARHVLKNLVRTANRE